MNKSKIIGLLLLSITFFGCGEKTLEPKEYVQWVNDPENGLSILKQEGDYKFLLQYQPVSYMVVNELQLEEITEKQLKENAEAKEGMQYFTLKLSTSQNQPVFSGNWISDSLTNYVNYKIQKDFYLLEDYSDTIPCKLFHFENTNGMTPFDTFVLGFESNTESVGDKKILFNANAIGLKWVEMKIDSLSIKNLPKVETI